MILLKKYLAASLLIFLILSISGCKKNDNPVTSNGSLTGTWVLANITANTSTGTVTLTADQANVHITMVLKSDNSFQMNLVQDTTTSNDSGTYSINNGSILFTSQDGTQQTWTYTISGSTLTAHTTMDLSAYGFPGQTPVTLVFNKQ